MTRIRIPRIALGLTLLLPLPVPAQLPGTPEAPGQAAAPAKAGARPTPEDIRKRLSEAEVELARIEAPGGLALGAPPGVPEADLVARRFLLRQLVRGYQGHLSELSGAENAERRRADVQARQNAWKGFDKPPPYSVLLVDRLRGELQKETLRVESLEAKLRIVDDRIQTARSLLDRFQSQLRKEQENLESGRRDPGVASLATWRRDMAALGSRAAGAQLAYFEESRASTAKDLEVSRLEFTFLEAQLKEAEGRVSFTREDLDLVQDRIQTRREALHREMDAALRERDAVNDALAATAARLKTAREDRERSDAELARAKQELPAVAAEAEAPQGGDKTPLERLDPAQRLAAQRALERKEALTRRTSDLEKEAATRTAVVASLERAEELQTAKARNAAIQVELLGNLLTSNDLQSAFWSARHHAASGEGREAVELRRASEASREILGRLAPITDYVRHQLQLTLAQLSQQQAALLAARSPAEAEHAQALVELFEDRERSYLRSLGETEDLRRLAERWLADFRAQTEERGTAVRTRHWIATAGDMVRAAWNFELFAVQDTIEVDGQKVTGSRGITVGKVVQAVLILVVGFFVVRFAVRLLGRLAERRWKADPNEVRLMGKWLVALGMVVLVLISLEMVKIPLTVFAFLGGAIAIGLGFGMQNLLKNLISGVMVITERPFRLGDTVEVGGIRGEVTDLNLRACTIRDVNGIETLVPNSTLIEQNVTNWTYTSRKVRFTVRVGVAYGSPVREVAELLKQAAERHGLVLDAPAPEVLLEDFGADALVFALNYWLELKPGTVAREVASDLRFMIEKAFAEHGIVIAFPQRDVHLDSARPLQVQVIAGPGPGPAQKANGETA
jgi:small-conductance mechanosensitive channel